jgi:hypothetical protein
MDMNILCRVLAVCFILILVGCTTPGGGSVPYMGEKNKDALTDEQLVKMGIKETYDKRQ